MARLRSLDGLRGVAILLVIVAHAASAALDPDDTGLVGAVGRPVGQLGVTVFFVLSGFLITGILVREHDRTGTVSLRAFYLRRTLRIWPAFYVFLAVVGVLALVGAVAVSGTSLLAAATFTYNYVSSADSWWVGHTWSLAVEEQYYLLWPLALLFLSRRRAAWLAAAVVLASPLLRTATWLLVPHSAEGQVPFYFHTRADALALGSLVALAPSTFPSAWTRVVAVLRRPVVTVAALAALLAHVVASVVLAVPYEMAAGYSLTAVCAATVLVAAGPGGSPAVQRALAIRPLVLAGLVSFSWYLWQQLFLTDLNTTWTGTPGLDVACSLLVAVLSYRLVEQPFLRLQQSSRRRERVAV
ncbi:acyltransferase family protein [Solicola sp. PLA-1-18]|uniref:acyltransferase family protein n=1 Tax=Solicola sp. PLA-1-18 TaxID=3380532 RepID=UPI003B7638E1